MLDYPMYIRMPTDKGAVFFAQPSSAEAVIASLITAQDRGWLRLHGFVLLPDALEMVASLIRQGVAGTVAQLQAETIPVLSVLMPTAGVIWASQYSYAQIKTQVALDARLEMLRLSPVANAVVDDARTYPYSSSSPRYRRNIAPYAGFRAMPPSTVGTSNGMSAQLQSGSVDLHTARTTEQAAVVSPVSEADSEDGPPQEQPDSADT